MSANTDADSDKFVMIDTPRGTQDYAGPVALLREQVIADITAIFRKYGGTPLDTPVFERREYLMKKYGDDAKLIYDLQSTTDEANEATSASQKERLCLRYDLTVPLARYLAQNNIVKLRRYHIGKVYRRDKPAMNHGRYREFYQCDFDMIGEPATMLPEVQLLAIGAEILQKFNLRFRIKINFHENLVAVLRSVGIPDDLHMTVCSSIDKLGKLTWPAIKAELLVKLLKPEQIDALIERFTSAGAIFSAECGDQFRRLMAYSRALGGLDQYLQFVPTLARGMDYYTGLIFEYELVDAPEIGTVIAGGRYDNLVSMFKPTLKAPALGLSVGFERLVTYLLQHKSNAILISDPQPCKVFIATIPKGCDSATIESLTAYKFVIYHQLTQLPNCQPMVDPDPRRAVSKQLDAARESNCTVIIYLGSAELHNQSLTLRFLADRRQVTRSLSDPDVFADLL